ncbi:threonine dehydratase [Halodesulfurarchaeum formicicum]|uniref:threonine ammonia-lyase n=1 Tax=Halodesulfurarchaeum formicicum TaxID=1873524 RepID=A0A1D8S6S1_9EURY|nr:threonine ammonia-lyase [Halodesulfurarchaeum formicicum]AOW81045.1 threonine dehydratase [Halodesulfurarchaeum formicicum]APE96382.1 threonine dehydratase [Halodesulfurarchaeum formicicum]
MLSLSDIETARDRVDDVALRTSLESQRTFSRMTGADVRLKLENTQRTGSFKIRGATNRIRSLTEEEREGGVITASAGNHAQGVALAAKHTGVDALIVMPEFAPISKVNATESYGAEIELYGEDYADAQERAHELAEDSDRTYVHAYDDQAVQAGQGTIGLEIIEDCPEVDTVVVPIGGGGLIGGIATAIKARKPDTRVIGVQAEGAATVANSLDKGATEELDSVDTIADGIATGAVGETTLPIIDERVDEIVTVDDSETASAMVLLLERVKTLVEGAGAVPIAALLGEKFDIEDDETIVTVLSGGNIDLNLLTTVLERGLVDRGRFVKLRTVMKDRPGALRDFLNIVTNAQANIYEINHDRARQSFAIDATEIEMDLETRGHEHVEEILSKLRDAGFQVEVRT